MTLDFSRCRRVWIPDEERWSPPPPHVQVGVRQIVANPWFLLADDMGGMKTAQAIIAAQFLHDAGVIDRVIVVAPASVRPKVWFDEDLGQLREQVFEDKYNIVSEYHTRFRQWVHGPKDVPELRWIITNYEYIRSDSNLVALLPYCGPKTMLILDESSAVRTWNAKQTKACMKLRWKTNKFGNAVLGEPRCGRVLEMNGTPLAESPLDLFSQANLLHPDILDCRYVTHFKARYAVQVPILGAGGRVITDPRGNAVKKIESWTNLEDLQRRMAPYVLRREAKEMGIDFALPPVGLEVVLTPKTWAVYKEMRDDLVIWLESGVATAATAAVKGMRLAQITSGFVGGVEGSGLHDTPWVDEPVGEPIAKELIELIEIMEPHSQYEAEKITAMQLSRVIGATAVGKIRGEVAEIGREKLDFALAWQAELLRRDPNLKLLTWCRFVPELRRYLAEVRKIFGHPVGAASGSSILGKSVKEEREAALRLLHPKTAPEGACTVGATQGTGAMGLNFTACHTVLDMSYDFSPWKKKQGDARVNRPGQTGPVSFYYLIAVGPKGQKTIDHHIMLTRLGKANLNEWTVKAWVKALKEE